MKIFKSILILKWFVVKLIKMEQPWLLKYHSGWFEKVQDMQQKINGSEQCFNWMCGSLLIFLIMLANLLLSDSADLDSYYNMGKLLLCVLSALVSALCMLIYMAYMFVLNSNGIDCTQEQRKMLNLTHSVFCRTPNHQQRNDLCNLRMNIKTSVMKWQFAIYRRALEMQRAWLLRRSYATLFEDKLVKPWRNCMRRFRHRIDRTYNAHVPNYYNDPMMSNAVIGLRESDIFENTFNPVDITRYSGICEPNPNLSMHNSLLRRRCPTNMQFPSYELSTPQEYTWFDNFALQQRHASFEDNICADFPYFINDAEMSVYTMNLRIWLSSTIFKRLAEQIDKINQSFIRLDLQQLQVGIGSLESLEAAACDKKVLMFVPTLPDVLRFLRISVNQVQLVQRLRELANNTYLSQYQYDTTTKWSMPSDAAIVFHCFCVYMDTQMIGEKHRFSNRYVISIYGNHPFTAALNAMPTDLPCALLHHPDVRRPSFYFTDGKQVFKNNFGEQNLFAAIVQMIVFLKQTTDGYLERTYLGSSGINILNILNY